MFDVPAYIPIILFGLSVLSIGAIFVLSSTAALRTDFEFFPPPSGSSWQHKIFRILFRVFLYPLIILTLIKFEVESGFWPLVRYVVGGSALIIGFGLAFWITGQMGWRNAFGEKKGLKTDGWFGLSRNPVYVATWLGLIGWALVVNSSLVSILLALWAFMYVVAPLVEEPWLEQQYGDDYREYRKQTRRFF